MGHLAQERFGKHVIFGYYSSMLIYANPYGEKGAKRRYDDEVMWFRVMSLAVKEFWTNTVHIQIAVIKSHGRGHYAWTMSVRGIQFKYYKLAVLRRRSDSSNLGRYEWKRQDHKIYTEDYSRKCIHLQNNGRNLSWAVTNYWARWTAFRKLKSPYQFSFVSSIGSSYVMNRSW